MSNAFYTEYGTPKSFPWFDGLKQIDCRSPDTDLKELDRESMKIPALYFLCLNQGVYYVGIAGTKKDGGLFRRLHNHWRETSKPFEYIYAFELPVGILKKWESKAIKLMNPEGNNKEKDYRKRPNDHIDKISTFLESSGYFSKYSNQRKYRIDVIFH